MLDKSEHNFNIEVTLDKTGTFLSVNQDFQDLMGYDDLVSSEKNFIVYIHPHDLGDASSIFEISKNNTFEARYKTKSGPFKFIHWLVYHREEKIILKGRDISDEKIAFERSRKIRTIIEQTPDFVGMADLFGNALYVNDAGKKMCGLDPSFNEKEHHLGYFHPKWAENDVINIAIPTAMKEGKWYGRLALINLNGPEIPVSAVIISHKDENGNIGYFSCIMRDISEQLEKEQLIQQQQKEYLALFNNISDPILIVDKSNGKIIDCNNSFLEKFEYGILELKEKSIEELYRQSHADTVKENLQNLQNGLNKQVKFNVIQFSKDDHFCHVEISANAYTFFGKEALIWVIKDVTDQMRTETKLRLFAEQLQYSNQHLKNLYGKLQRQSDELAERNKDFIESISYAKKIQTAIFPSIDDFQSIFPQSFIFFKPKAIVSGDFYWFYKTENIAVVAVGDCTGHGVPGAFMSMIGITVLNDIVRSKGITEPSRVLSILNKTVVRTIKQKGVDFEARDGMDIAICTMNLSTNQLYFGGANRHLAIIRNNKAEKVEGTKTSIGGFREVPKKFTTKTLDYTELQGVYLTTDGFTDQFGGSKMKKFTTKRFYSFIESIHEKKAKDQLKDFQSSFNEWKGEEEQLDDILVVGFNPNSIQFKSRF